MFLITPKPKAPARIPNAAEATRNQPLAKIMKPTRVQNACDRCRLKKVKCDGDRPCLRCSQDQTPCLISKKPVPSDPKLVLREYVQSMESQQTRLIKALQKVHRDVQQSIKEEDMNEIVQIVRACGFEFEPLSTMSSSYTKNDASELKQEIAENADNEVATCLENIHHRDSTGDEHQLSNVIPKNIRSPKRKRGRTDNQTNLGIAEDREHAGRVAPGKMVFMPDGGLNEGFEPPSSPSKRQRFSTSPAVIDDYWSLDSYWDQIIRLHSPSEADTPFPAPISDYLDLPSQLDPSHSMAHWPSDTSGPGLHDHSHPTLASGIGPYRSVEGFQEAMTTAEAAEPSSSDFAAGLDWDSTLWWDPALVFDMDLENQNSVIEN